MVDSTGRRISCSALVCNADYLPTLPSERQAQVTAAAAAAREVCVTRVSIVSGRVLPDCLGVAVIPPSPSHLPANANQGLGNPHCIQVVQLDNSSSVCPAGATLLYVLCSTVLPFFSCLCCLSLDLKRLPAFSDIAWHESNHHPLPLNQSSIHTILTSLIVTLQVSKWVGGKPVRKVIYVPGKILNIVC